MSNSTSEVYSVDAEPEDYEVIRVSVSWGLLSIAVFTAIMVLQMFGPNIFGLTIAHIWQATLPLSCAGLIFGIAGLRFGRSRGTARLGAFLNGVILLCVFILLPVTYYVMRRFG